jgi:hypothetical protein
MKSNVDKTPSMTKSTNSNRQPSDDVPSSFIWRSLNLQNHDHGLQDHRTTGPRTTRPRDHGTTLGAAALKAMKLVRIGALAWSDCFLEALRQRELAVVREAVVGSRIPIIELCFTKDWEGTRVVLMKEGRFYVTSFTYPPKWQDRQICLLPCSAR